MRNAIAAAIELHDELAAAREAGESRAEFWVRREAARDVARNLRSEDGDAW